MIDWINMMVYILTGLLICILVVLLTYWRRRDSGEQRQNKIFSSVRTAMLTFNTILKK